MRLSSAETSYQESRVKEYVSNLGYFAMKYFLVGPLLRIRHKASVTGLEHLRGVEGAVIASNHQAFIDHLFLALYSPRKVRFWAKSDWWGTGLKAQLKGFFFALLNQVPAYREGGERGELSIRLAAQCVSRGELFAIYPEGTRSPDGRIYRGRTGAIRVALLANAPIVPSAILGTRELQGKDFVPRRGPFSLRFGAPIDTTPYDIENPDSVRALTDLVMERIVALADVEYVDVYARKR